MSSPDITLYTTQTPNGIKISIALEELGYVCPPTFLYFPKRRFNSYSINIYYRLPYKVEKIDISKNVQKEPYVAFPLTPLDTYPSCFHHATRKLIK